MKPKEFFDSRPDELEQIVKVVRKGFGRDLDFQDIYNHVTNPEKLFLMRNDKITAMASYNTKSFGGLDSLIVEGIAISPEVQGKGIFKLMTDQALEGAPVVCLRTQNPRMYRALEKYCFEVYPGLNKNPSFVDEIMSDFAKYLNCKIDEKGVIRGCYGGLFYGIEPHHQNIDPIFEQLGVDKSKGDGLLVVGVRYNLFCNV